MLAHAKWLGKAVASNRGQPFDPRSCSFVVECAAVHTESHTECWTSQCRDAKTLQTCLPGEIRSTNIPNNILNLISMRF